MARPRKDKSLLMNQILRIMLSADQKSLLEAAATESGQETSTWARNELLKLAKRVLAKKERTENGSD